MINNQCVIIYTENKKGKRHGYDIYKKNHPTTPKEVINVFDLGYLGVEEDFSDQKSPIPNRKKRSQKDLAKGEKECNQNHSRKRMAIEHTICMMKKYRIIIEKVFRNRLRKYNWV